LLFLIIIALQVGNHFLDFSNDENTSVDGRKWLSLQRKVDSLKLENPQNSYKIYPFNPNFITDFKGYKLGMSVEQIDRLLAYRKQGKFANSAKEFQRVTGISDSLLIAISPYFKFPDWVNNKKNTNLNEVNGWVDYSKNRDEKEVKTIGILDINEASKEDLMKVYGIGDVISDRILRQKEIFGAFVSIDQMNDVYGLPPEVVEKLHKSFKVTNPNPKKININNATIKELGQFPYFRYPISKNIVTYRSMNGDLKIEDLTKIKDFPVDKLKIITLYLEF
jgi:DNA uptake protein ComE-like DNA-binding protein